VTLQSRALFALRLAIAVGLLAVVFRIALPNAAPGEAWYTPLERAWISPPLPWLLTAAGAFGLSYLLGALRFQWLLQAAKIPARYAVLLRAYLIGNFFNLVLPGLILGDVYRFADARRDAGSGSAVLGLVVLERLLGFSALGIMALVAAPLLPADTAGTTLRASVAGLGILISVAPFLALTEPGRALFAAISRSLARVWPRAGEASIGALEAAATAASERGLLMRTFALSLANQWLPVGAVVALAVPLDHTVAWYWFAAIVPFVTLASLLPISIGGTGVREALFVALFGAVGMRAEVALALSLSTLGVALGWGLLGLALFAAGRRSTTSDGGPAESRP